jgi:hypothetical protein
MDSNTNDGPRARSGRPGTWRVRLARRAGVLVAAGSVLAACGAGSASGDTFIGGTYQQAVAYTDCMRSHGVPNFPDPDSQGNYNNNQIEAVGTGTAERNAFSQCRSLLPNEGTGLSVTELQTMMEQNLQHALKAALCMRQHGIPGFPEPTPLSTGSGVNWPLLPAGIDQNSPQYTKAFRKCSGPDVGGPIPPNLAPGFVPPSPPPGAGNGPGATASPGNGSVNGP